tara:strand:- start:52492 stop:53031 length:540 start_codon:yes stop_codon:yes gene_type:complete
MPKRNDILIALDNYNPQSLEEQGSKLLMVDFIENNKDCFKRENLEGHVTGSAWVVSNCGKKVCLVHHKKLKKWLQPGGHCDGEFRVKLVAEKEMQEETGLKTGKAFDGKIFDIDVHVIPEHKGVPEHIHYDIRYVFVADGNEKPIVSDESNDVKWFTFKEAAALDIDESVARMLAKSVE